MMPGETRSAAPGMAADLSRCQGCASLQQNLNEYVDALITLKQKIINTDNLLTEYQKKCDELQFARRENSTLHHQVEQMLQKISPLQKCQEELGSLKAELEEKKSSLKLYQETHQEYARVKEECLKSDAQKKKLEAKVKKLEEAAFKQIQDFKQLRNEKKVLEKEFKKTQERLDEFSKQKNEKELRHIGTQISSDSYGSIDKRKVKLLLKELWLCINTTHRLPGEGSKHSPEKSAKDNGCRESIEDDTFSPVPSSPPRSSDVQACLAELSMEIGGDFSASKNVDKEMPSGPSYGNEDRNPESVMPCQNDDESIDFSDHDPFFDEDLQAAMDFFRRPPPLLSPVPSPPLMSSPHLGPAPSSLALETCFGECTESSEDDSAQHRNSAEPVLEDDTAESQNYFGSFMGNEGSTTLFKQPTPHDAFQAPNTSGVNEATTVPLRTLTPGLQEHPTTHSLASEEHPTTSLQLMNVKNGGISDDTKRQTEVREVDKSVQTEEAVDEPPGALGVGKLSGSSAATGRSALCFSPLSKRPLSELLESGTLLSKIIGSPKSELTRRTLADEIASKSKRARTISELFRRVCREMEKERGGLRGLLLGELSESEEETPGDSVLAAGLDVDAGFSSSSTSGALSVCSGPPSSSGLQYDNDTRSPPRRVCTEVPHSEQRPAFAASSLFSLQSEVAPERSVGGNELEKSLRALHPELGAFNFNNRSSSEVECTKIVKGVTKIYSLPQSVFMKSTKDGQGESKGPRTDPALDKSGVTPSVSSQGDLVTSGFGFVKSSSWHHSDLLRRNEQGSLRAEWKHEQETSHQVGKAMPLLENRGSAPGLEPPTENNSPVQFKAASLLPNQVSVITKQVKPEKIRSAALERFRLQESEPALATENLRPGTDPMASTLKHGGDRQDETQMVSEVAATKRTSPEVSPSQRQLDSDSPSTVLPVENFPCSTNSRLTFSFKNIPVQHQDVVTEASAQEERQKQSQPLPTTNLEADKLPATKVIASGVCPSEEAPRGDPGGSACEAQAAAGGSPGTPQKSKGTLELTSRAPSGPVLEGSATTVTTSSSAFCRKDEEVRALTQNRLPDTVYCYTGLREGVADDTEVEESEAFSCSEGENESGPVVGGGQQDIADRPLTDSDTNAGAPETRPSIEVGHLTSALQGVDINALSEIDRLSTSEVVRFLESCQLRDSSSGDSLSECSSREALSKETSKELKESAVSGEECRKQPCEEETLETSEESVLLEEDDYPLGKTSPLPECSLETLSEVLTKIGPEPQAHCEDSDAKSTKDLLPVNMPNSMTTENLEEKVLSHETANSLPYTLELPPLTDVDTKSSPPIGDGPIDETLQSTPEDGSNVAGQVEGREDVLLKSGEPVSLGSSSIVEQASEQSSNGEAELAFQCQISTVTSEVINVLINKDQNLVIEKGDNWTIINGVAVMPSVDQVILCDSPEDTQITLDQEELEAGFIAVTSAEKSPEAPRTGCPFQEPQCGSHPSHTPEDAPSSGLSTNFDKSRLRNRPVKPSVRISSQIYSQDFECQIVASDHTYYNSKLEPCGKNKNRSKTSNKDQSAKPGKTSASSRVESNQSEISQSFSGERGNAKTQRSQTQTILANADTSTPPECSTDTLSKIRQEVGPPLPPLLAPLIATPPRTLRPVSPLMSSCSPSSPASPLRQVSPFCDILASPLPSPPPEDAGLTPPACASPSPSTAPASERVLSSPLQFCAATPKHALPVPGRLPLLAPGHTAVAGAQENSVKILDTMYPELSARARTLSILKGNIQLNRGPPADRKSLPGPVSAITGFKAITSMSTAFVKTRGNAGSDCTQDKSRDLGAQQDSSGKRTLSTSTLRSAKRLRLDTGSSESETREGGTEGIGRSLRRNFPQAEVVPANGQRSCFVPAANTVSQLPSNPKETVESHDKTIANALKKIAESSFDLLPVIRSHVYVGNISKKPVMRDQEKEVVYEFSTTKKHLAECLLHSILSELNVQKTSTEDHNYIHALCRVYVGICRQLGDLERARLFCYSILKEDFPESDKLTLFIANMWHDVFISQSVINKAMQLVARQRAKGEVLNCLRAFLNWEKSAPVDVGFMVSKLLLTIQLCPKTEFQSSEKFGEDLSDNTWEYIFAIDLLCCHQKWIWTHDNIISKELWPVMDKWIKYRKGHVNIGHTPDVIIASVLRLIGRLGQLGLKEGFPSAVKNISAVIGMFIQHAQDEDIPWGVQLAAVYALCDLSPSNPTEISKILEAWRKEASQSVPAAIVSYLEEAGALCMEEHS
ncbi:little elongation complex subunit 1 isoform X2 [Loxodonta africana]|uniref:little elongation complex subunit 1 isoform X2 n=2 Tax=Loxodonta africana TaxID=9785 RepID=UPI0030CB5C96